MKKEKRNEYIVEKRKNQILEAAVEVFSKKGYEGSTTKEIAKKAKVSEGTIFRYFETKKEILIYMLNVLIDQTLSEFVEQIENEHDPEEAIKSLLKLHNKFIVNNYDLLRILIYEVQFHKDLREEFRNSILDKIVDVSAGIIKEINPNSDVDPYVASRAVLGIFLGLVVANSFSKSEENVDEKKIISDVLDILTYGLKRSH